MLAARRVLGWVFVGLLLACGGTPRGAEAPAEREARAEPGGVHADPPASGEASGVGTAPPAATADAEPRPAGAGAGLPTECARSGDLCLPPRGFVQRLCQDAYAGAALGLLAKDSPFSRGYVRSREVKSVNTLGGPASDVNLRFGEEVLILTHTGAPGPNQMQVSGMGGYDVLRWDGTCATLDEAELALRPPVAPRYAPFSWRYIDTNIQGALLANSEVEAARRAHRKHCHGVSLGRISAACAQAESDLADSIVAAVRAGIHLPTPERMP